VAWVTFGIVTYFGVRGVTEGSRGDALAHAAGLAALERRIGIDVEAGIQELLLDVGGLSTVANWVYIYGHWPVIVATLIWLALRHPGYYFRLRDAMTISGVLGLVVFALYPVAPPRLAAAGIVDTVTQQSAAYRVLQPPALVNQYAALPSLHVGWDLLVGLTISGAATHRLLRWLGRTLPVLMIVAVLLTGNHYLLDVLGGLVLALIGLAGAMLLRRRHLRLEHRSRRRRPVLATATDPTDQPSPLPGHRP
jgi:membrane-associated phospholipid phosphatase